MPKPLQHEDIENYLLFLHAIPPSKVQTHLEELLSNPCGELSRLEICVPELCARICHQLFDGQAVNASFLGKAIEAALNTHSYMEEPQRLAHLDLNTVDICRFSYLIGRLRSSALLAQHRFELEHSPVLASDILDGGDAEEVLRALAAAAKSPLSIRQLRKEIGQHRLRQTPIEKGRLHDALLLVVRMGLIEAQTIRGTLKYSLSTKGRRLLGIGPDYLPKVKTAYQNYREGAPNSKDSEEIHLYELFAAVDADFSQER